MRPALLRHIVHRIEDKEILQVGESLEDRDFEGRNWPGLDPLHGASSPGPYKFLGNQLFHEAGDVRGDGVGRPIGTTDRGGGFSRRISRENHLPQQVAAATRAVVEAGTEIHDEGFAVNALFDDIGGIELVA